MDGFFIFSRFCHILASRKVVKILINRKIGAHSFSFGSPPVIRAWASVAGKRESEGPLAREFDRICRNGYWGEASWELAERKMQTTALDTLCKKASIRHDEIQLVYSGDLLNQCISSAFTLTNKNIPHLGLYGACSTMAEALLLSSMTVGGDYCNNVVAMTSSHFASSERQYRFPLNYGGQRPQTSQWTVTGSGAALICKSGNGPRITGCTIGTVVDLGITDANNMGAAMAPAALDTIKKHFRDFGVSADDFDMIVTGDLGQLGKDLLLSLSNEAGVPLGGRLDDCGSMIFDNTSQDVHSGGSGCGCSAVVLCAKLLDDLNKGILKRVLFCGTGALLSPTSLQQGLPIAGVCHAVCIEGGRK